MEVLQNSQKFRVRYGSLTELTEVPGTIYECCTRTPGIAAQAYVTHRSFGYGYQRRMELTEVPVTDIEILQNSEKFRVRHGSHTELTKTPGR